MMCHPRTFWLCLLLSVLILPSQAQETSYELSYLLLRNSDGQVLREREPDKLRTPASTLKLLTAAAALEKLGPSHTFVTKVFCALPLRRGKTESLCLLGDADPELNRNTLEQLSEQVSAFGVRKVERLLVDPGPYSFPPYGTGWAWDDAGHSYSPEIGGLSIDSGLQSTPVQAKSWYRSQPGPRGLWSIPGWEGVLVRGEEPTRVAAPRIHLRAGEKFQQLLAEHRVQTEGSVQPGAATGEVIASHQSRTLVAILKDALWHSDNLAMELLYRASSKARPSALQKQKLRVVDGSGLSRYNLVSARQLVTVLRASPELAELLPGAGEGTLHSRFREGWSAYQVRAKTGSMSNISSLAGYLFPGTPQECTFAILINGHVGSYAERKQIEDELLERWAREISWPFLRSEDFSNHG